MGGVKRQREEECGEDKRVDVSLAFLPKVLRAKQILEANSSSEALLIVVSELKDLGPLPTDVLRQTHIGRIVNQVSKEAANHEVRRSLQELLSEWKRAFRTSGVDKSATSESPSADCVPPGELSPNNTPSHSCAYDLTMEVYRKRLVEQNKYSDTKPGSKSIDNCLQNPPAMPPEVTVYSKSASLPARVKEGHFLFPDFPAFKPNLSPEQVLQSGSFGGTYFRDISSAVTGIHYNGRQVIKEFPDDWFQGLCLDKHVVSQQYRKSVNKYLVACGGSLGMWETSGWISAIDPYGWFQWYCRFFLGRRSSDDARQVDRWLKGQGPKGRWRLQLINKIIRDRTKFDDPKVSPVIRQVLLHWAYELTSVDFEAHREMKANAK
jgi:hypothetical protein